jgi:hypothetical protein
MAGFEDIQNTGKAVKKGGFKDTSSVDNGVFRGVEDVVSPNNKKTNTGKMVTCFKDSDRAIVRPTFTHVHDTECLKNRCNKPVGPTNLCQTHWDQMKHDTSTYEPGPYWLKGGADEANQIRTEDRIRRTEGRNAASKAHFETTGEHIPVSTPGRPYTSEQEKFDKEENHTQEVVNGRGREGGRTKLRPIPQPIEDLTAHMHQAAAAYQDSYGDEEEYENYLKDLMS